MPCHIGSLPIEACDGSVSVTTPPDLFADRYMIESLLGRGTFGIVQRAFDTRLKRTVALKVPHRLLASDEEFIQTFVQEAQTAAALSHPNIVTIYDVSETAEHLPYLAMRFLEGASLRDLMEQEKLLRLDRTLKILDQLASALDYLQDRRLVHRDIKPANIMIGADDEATLMDFGLARVLSGTHLSLSGVLAFTPLYASPEQIVGSRLTPASDRYCFAVIAYEMLAGRTPHAAFDTQVLLHAIRFEEPPLPEEVNGALPPALGRVLRKALAKKPEDRPESARLLVRDIRATVEPRLSYLLRTEPQPEPAPLQAEAPPEVHAGPVPSEQPAPAEGLREQPLEQAIPERIPPAQDVEPPSAASAPDAHTLVAPQSEASPAQPLKHPPPARVSSAPIEAQPTRTEAAPAEPPVEVRPEGAAQGQSETQPLWTPPASTPAPEVHREPAISPTKDAEPAASQVTIPNELLVYAEAGVERVAVFGRSTDVCPSCATVRTESYSLEVAPELPVNGCTSTWGCHCEYVPLIEEGEELPESFLATLDPGQRHYLHLLDLQRASARGEAEKIEVVVEPDACSACQAATGTYDPSSVPALPVLDCRRYPPCEAEYRLHKRAQPQAIALTFGEMLHRFFAHLQGKH